MSQKPNKRHHKHKRLKGSLTCFKGTALEKLAVTLYKGPLIEDQLIELRNVAKDAFGMRMQMAARMVYIREHISEQSLKIILNYLKSLKASPNAYRFADCFFNSYNGSDHYLTINAPKCTTKHKTKAFKLGKKDCIKAFDTYFTPILSRMDDKEILAICDNVLVGKYKDIKVALSFSIDFIYELYCNKMPDKISKAVFKMANNIDNTLSKYYQYDIDKGHYIVNKEKNNKYSVISQECATYLICYKHK